MKILMTVVASVGTMFSSTCLSIEPDAPDLRPIEINFCNYRDGHHKEDYNKVMGRMAQWMEENNSQPYATWRLDKLFAGEQDFDFVVVGAWTSGTSMGKDITQYMASASDISVAVSEIVDCSGLSLFSSLNVKATDGDGIGRFVLTVSDCIVAGGHSARAAIQAIIEYGEYRTSNGSPGGMWVWLPTLGSGDEDFDFKLASSYRNVEAFGAAFQWDRDNQADLKRDTLFRNLLKCDVPRGYEGETLINTLPDDQEIWGKK